MNKTHLTVPVENKLEVVGEFKPSYLVDPGQQYYGPVFAGSFF